MIFMDATGGILTAAAGVCPQAPGRPWQVAAGAWVLGGEMPEVCDFCPHLAAGEFDLPGGCIARPGERCQLLCLHHALRSQPIRGIYLVRVIDAAGLAEVFVKPW